MKAHNLYLNCLKQPHLLIGGSTGSGKSVLINGIIHTALCFCPDDKLLILIDPKRVELKEYRKLPHTLRYATEPDDAVRALQAGVNIMNARYKRMRGKKTDEPHVYIIVDELADLLQSTSKAEKLITTIGRLGRAANIHLILATQSPNRRVITAEIKTNMTSRIALRCEEAIESRQIINQKGAELLPRYGYGLFRSPDTIGKAELIEVPYVTDGERLERIRMWLK